MFLLQLQQLLASKHYRFTKHDGTFDMLAWKSIIKETGSSYNMPQPYYAAHGAQSWQASNERGNVLGQIAW